MSAAGAKRGRGKGTGRAIIKDFNRGQQIGLGRHKLLLGGLNAPVVSARKVVEVQDVGPNEEFSKKVDEARKEMNVYRKYKENPIDMGWSGRRSHGRAAGQPDDYNETPLEGFESTVLMLRPLQTMSGSMGRVRNMHAMVATGNKNGLAGFSVCLGKDGRATVRRARNRASQGLVYIPRWEEHTVLHDFFSRYYYTTVFVQRKPKGYGIRAHRIIKAICELVGITDLYAKVEGVTGNQINLTKAFFLGLMNQRPYQDLADEKKLHLVDMREENFYYPQILASPSTRVRSFSEVSNENRDFTYFIYDGKVKLIQPESPIYLRYVGTPGWDRHLNKLDYQKNREKSKLMMAAKYGDTKVLDVFPYFKSNADSFNKPKQDTQEE